MAQLQPAEHGPPQPPPPAMERDSPEPLLEKAAKTDSCRLDSPSHWGQGASSFMRLMGRSRSKR